MKLTPKDLDIHTEFMNELSNQISKISRFKSVQIYYDSLNKKTIVSFSNKKELINFESKIENANSYEDYIAQIFEEIKTKLNEIN